MPSKHGHMPVGSYGKMKWRTTAARLLLTLQDILTKVRQTFLQIDLRFVICSTYYFVISICSHEPTGLRKREMLYSCKYETRVTRPGNINTIPA